MSSRKEQKEALKRERLEREQARQAAERRRRLMGLGAAAILGIAAIAAIVVVALSGGDDGGSSTASGGEGATVTYPDDPPELPPPTGNQDLKALAKAAKCDRQDPKNEGATHTEEPVAYVANPPTSGNHHPQPAADGAYDRDPGTNHVVHSLEHGRVVLQFDPAAPQPVIDQMKALFDEDTYHMLLVENATDMPGQVAATAWDHSIVCPELNEDSIEALRAFRDQFRDQGPENVP